MADMPFKTYADPLFETVNSVEDFDRLVGVIKDYGLEKIRAELEAHGWVLADVLRVDEDSKFNAFARIPALLLHNPGFVQSYLLGVYADEWFVAHNLPRNDEKWESNEEGVVGKASMSKLHRFIGYRGLNWRMCNVAIAAASMDPVAFRDMMYRHHAACLRYADMIRVTNPGFYLHVFGWNSMYSWHTHVIDLDHTGPSYDALQWRNLSVDDVVTWAESKV